MKHVEVSLARPVTTVMVFLGLALIGLISSRLLPLEKFPDIEFPGIFVQIPYQGASPEEIETLITRPVEEALATLSGIERMQSTTTDSQAQIFMNFGWDSDTSAAGIDARAKVDAIRGDLPTDVRRINVFTGSLGDQPILVLRLSSGRDLSTAWEMLERNVRRRIERVEGVSRVNLEGVEPPEIRILLKPDRLAAHNINIRELRERLEKSNFAVSAGRITENGRRFSVRPQGEFTDIEQLRNLPVGVGNTRLDDIADVELRSGDRNYGRHLDQRYAVGLDVFKQTGANMVEVADRVMEEVASIGELPEMRGISIFPLEDSAAGVKESLRDLVNAGLIGAVLALVVLYLFLRQLATTLIVVLSVPFSLLITLGAMYFSGLTLNILSLMGLMLAIGMLVDNAVVVTESIFRYRQMNPDEPRAATLAGVNEVGLAVMAGTLTSIVVFVPVMFGEKTQITVFLVHVAVTIAVAMAASLVIAQTLVPMLASRIAPPPAQRAGTWMAKLTNGYLGSLKWTLARPWWTALIVVLILGSIMIPIKFLVKFDTFPQEMSRRLFLPYHIEGVHPLEQIEAAVNKVENYLYSKQEELDIISVYSYWDPERAQSTILLKDGDEASVPTKEVIEKIKNELPEIVIGKPSFEFNQQGGGEGLSLQLAGESTAELTRLSRDVIGMLGTIDGLTDLRSTATAGDIEVRVKIDRQRALNAGLDSTTIAQAIGLAMRGDNLREFRGDDGEIEVRLAFRESDKQTLEDLRAIPLGIVTGSPITLGTVADFELTRGPQSIRRIDRQTAIVINGSVDTDSSMDELRPEIKSLMDQFSLPPGYSWKFGTGFERNDETQKTMMVNILLGIALIFIVMAALFESVLYPLSIITSIAFSVVGVFWFFGLTGTTFSFMASIGIMILIGVVVNNGIVLVDHINNLRREGMPRYEAIIQSGRDRIRPILMTVATTILGLTPLAVGDTLIGGDGPPYFPMARAIIGGLAFSTLTSLLLVPTMYVWFDGMAMWWRKVRRTARAGHLSTDRV
ncbi:MAG: efflux RND transporter permease subunit [Gammaproteobacteria bacterium]|nr:efflux RND transporter permease subunit [Gammaproteobacteria bacterium]